MEEIKEEVKQETKIVKEVKGNLVKVTEESKNNIEYKEKKFSASKALLVFVLFISFGFAGVVLYGWMQGLQDAAMLMTAVLSPSVAVISMYIWKSKQENMIKLKSIYGKLYTAEYELNQNGYGGSYGYGNSFQNLMPYNNDGMDMNGMG